MLLSQKLWSHSFPYAILCNCGTSQPPAPNFPLPAAQLVSLFALFPLSISRYSCFSLSANCLQLHTIYNLEKFTFIYSALNNNRARNHNNFSSTAPQRRDQNLVLASTLRPDNHYKDKQLFRSCLRTDDTN